MDEDLPCDLVTPVLLMVSGGSDSTAMLELACKYAAGELTEEPYASAFAQLLPKPELMQPYVLHVNHMLRGNDSDDDERFVCELCESLDVPYEIARVDIAAQAKANKGGMEALAREERYTLAQNYLERICAQMHVFGGYICTAHTLDDRIETFFMRALVGTGPGGLGSIPRQRENIRRPLLDVTREQLRDWLRAQHPGVPDNELWREDKTNFTGVNFRARIRRELMPVLRELRPGFEPALAQTMDLIADEQETLQQEVDSLVYRSLIWNGEEARIDCAALEGLSKPLARRVLRSCLLVVNPDARLEAAQIDRILDNLHKNAFTTETSGGLRVLISDGEVNIYKAQ